jgi:hypothetical protein
MAVADRDRGSMAETKASRPPAAVLRKPLSADPPGGRTMERPALELEKEGTGSQSQAPKPVAQPPRPIVVFVLALFVVAATAMGLLVHFIPHAATQDPQVLQTFLQEDGRRVFIFTAAMMAWSGVLGGCLFDIRGLIKHSIAEDYDRRFDLSYVLRPIAGFLTGIIAFFLLLGGALTFTTHGITEGAGWSTFAGRMPYLAVGILSGYSSQVFMMKLKDVSDAIFAPRDLGSHER